MGKNDRILQLARKLLKERILRQATRQSLLICWGGILRFVGVWRQGVIAQNRPHERGVLRLHILRRAVLVRAVRVLQHFQIASALVLDGAIRLVTVVIVTSMVQGSPLVVKLMGACDRRHWLLGLV